MAHQTLVNALSGRGKTVTVSNGQVVIDLAPFIAIVKQNLVARGFTLINRLPPIHPTLALFSAKDLVRAQTLYRLINDLKIVLPILSLLLIGAGRLHRPQSPAGPDRSRARLRRVHAGPGPRSGRSPGAST